MFGGIFGLKSKLSSLANFNLQINCSKISFMRWQLFCKGTLIVQIKFTAMMDFSTSDRKYIDPSLEMTSD